MSNKLLQLPNILLLAGQQQNVGKTTLACRIISHFSRKYSVSALKVTPHFHKCIGKAEAISKNADYQIFEEISTETNKDTSRMLTAGAEKAYMLQSSKETMLTGLKEVLGLMPSEQLIVCESAGVRDIIKPGVFLALRQLYCKVCSIEDENMFSLADRIVTYTVNGFDMAMNDLEIDNGKWILRTE